MEQNAASVNTREEIKEKLRRNFNGKIVRKDLTKKIWRLMLRARRRG